jgi:hypothetical protein
VISSAAAIRSRLPPTPPTHTGHWSIRRFDCVISLRLRSARPRFLVLPSCSPLVTFVGFFFLPRSFCFFLWFSARRFTAPILYLLTLLFVGSCLLPDPSPAAMLFLRLRRRTYRSRRCSRTCDAARRVSPRSRPSSASPSSGQTSWRRSR